MNNTAPRHVSFSTRDFLGFGDIVAQLGQEKPLNAVGYPPYNVSVQNEENGPENYTIEVAVAGFNDKQILIQTEGNKLIISGEQQTEDQGEVVPLGTKKEYIHRGIAERSFKLGFTLREHLKVTEANLKDGMLTVSLHTEIPEEMKKMVQKTTLLK